jgi:hypothetical protein
MKAVVNAARDLSAKAPQETVSRLPADTKPERIVIRTHSSIDDALAPKEVFLCRNVLMTSEHELPLRAERFPGCPTSTSWIRHPRITLRSASLSVTSSCT